MPSIIQISSLSKIYLPGEIDAGTISPKNVDNKKEFSQSFAELKPQSLAEFFNLYE